MTGRSRARVERGGSASAGVVDSGTLDISGTSSGASIVTLSGTGGVTLGARTLTLSNASGTDDGAVSGEGGARGERERGRCRQRDAGHQRDELRGEHRDALGHGRCDAGGEDADAVERF